MFYSILFVTHLPTFAQKEINVENKTNIDEVWRKLSGFGGKYQISSYGRIRTNDGDTDAECRPVSTQTDGRYPRAILYGPDGVKKVKRVADLVADTFLWNPNGYRKVVCLDGNTYNVHLDNLMWVSEDDFRDYYRNMPTRTAALGKKEMQEQARLEQEALASRCVWRDYPDGSFKISDRIFQDALNYFVYGVIRDGFFAPEKETFDDLFG